MVICYRDRTYCTYYLECQEGETCSRALTEEVRKKSEEIGMPVCRWLEHPSCFVEKQGGLDGLQTES